MAACASMPNRIQLITVSSVSEIIVGPPDEPVTKLKLALTAQNRRRHRTQPACEPSRRQHAGSRPHRLLRLASLVHRMSAMLRGRLPARREPSPVAKPRPGSAPGSAMRQAASSQAKDTK